MPIINRLSRENDLALKQQLDALSPEEKASLRQQIQTEIVARKGNLGQRIMGGVRKGVSDVSDIFLQMGGIKPPEREKVSELDELIKLYKFDLERKLGEQKVKEAETASKYQEDLARRFGEQAGETPTIEPSVIPPETARSLQVAPGEITPAKVAPSAEIAPSPKITKIVRKADGTYEEKEIDNPEYQPWLKRQEEEIKTTGKRAEELSKMNVNFEKVSNLFSGVIAQVKGAGIEQSGLGLWPGLKGAFNVAIKNPEFSRTASAYGQKAETAFALNSILTGQNRVIRGVIGMIMQTIPDRFDPDEVVAAKTAQSIRNAFMLTKAFSQAGLTSEILRKMSQSELNNINVQDLISKTQLTDDEEAFIEAKINAVLATPPAKERKLLGKGQPLAEDEYQRYLKLSGR